jgi:dihydrofolate reductase
VSSRPETGAFLALSLDGFIAREDGSVGWLAQPEDGGDGGFTEFLSSVDAMVMGRVTFEQVLGFDVPWPYEGTPVTVLSRTLADVPGELRDRAEVSALPPRELLDELGVRGAKRVYVDGGSVVRALLAEDLLDQLVLTRVPVLLGTGIPLFGPLERDVHWTHASTRALPGGLVQSRYLHRPAR